MLTWFLFVLCIIHISDAYSDIVKCSFLVLCVDWSRLGSDGQEFFTSYDEVYESFDAMGLQENLLRGIYAYGMFINA